MFIQYNFLTAFFIFIIGLAFGSFGSVVTARLVKEEGIFFGRSKCISCKKTLSAKELVPLISWLWQKGRCRGCGNKISLFYPAIELITGMLFLGTYLEFGLSFEFFFSASLGFILLLIIIIDLKSQIIPDELQIALLILGLVNMFSRAPLMGSALESIAGGCAGAVLGLGLRWIFTKWKKREALGMGDVKFLCVAGILLGPSLFVPFIFLSGILGVVTAALWNRRGKSVEFPFAPALSMSLFISITVPEIPQLFWKIYGI